MVGTHSISPPGFEESADCEFQSRLGPYLDGELSGDQQAQVQSHLGGCAICQGEAQQIRELSQLADAISGNEMSLAAIRRIHRAVDADRQFTVFRIATVLTGLAASALIVGAAWMAELPSGGGRGSTIPFAREMTMPAWEQMASSGTIPLPTGNADVELANRRLLEAQSGMARDMRKDLDGRKHDEQ